MSSPALAGVAATREFVIVADRDPADRVDIFRCFHADGSEAWTLRYSAPGSLDYGNSPRATPLLHDKVAYLSGAHGHFHAVELATGKVLWKKHFLKDFDGPAKLSWGFCGSPIVVEGRLVIQPGGRDASIVALDPATGEVLWKSPGRPPGHSSLIAAEIAGRTQLIGYDDQTLGGWDVATGERRWTLKPEHSGDFNVPTPIVSDGRLIVATENNGTRLYEFDPAGGLVATPLAASDELLPDCQTPVLVEGMLFGVAHQLFCLDTGDALRLRWRSDESGFREYASLIAGPDCVLATTLQGQLILFAADAEGYRKISEVRVFDDEAGLYSHPALVGRRLYVRGSGSLLCLRLGDE
ncbi:outer membrane biogenesis protein BamB [Planctomyces sp. SH-PL14]|nr:outer membrane biogenesis protein BamB [Planctomyces sp. SH-PL14]